MSTLNTVRAWKDEDYRMGLSEADLDCLPQHPAGLSELSDAQLTTISGGTDPICITLGITVGVIITLATHRMQTVKAR